MDTVWDLLWKLYIIKCMILKIIFYSDSIYLCKQIWAFSVLTTNTQMTQVFLTGFSKFKKKEGRIQLLYSCFKKKSPCSLCLLSYTAYKIDCLKETLQRYTIIILKNNTKIILLQGISKEKAWSCSALAFSKSSISLFFLLL